jgi:hypothetical protein
MTLGQQTVQTPPSPAPPSPTLLKVTQALSPSQMFNEFIFDQSVAGFTNSKLFWQFAKNGVTLQVQSASAVLSADQPNVIFVTVPTSSFVGNDTLITYVQLIDSSQKPLPPTQQFSNDISLLKVLSDNQSSISSLNSQLAQSRAQTAAATASYDSLLANSLPTQVVKVADVESDHAIELTFTTDKPGRVRVTNTTTGKSQDTQQGITHTVLFDQLGYTPVSIPGVSSRGHCRRRR